MLTLYLNAKMHYLFKYLINHINDHTRTYDDAIAVRQKIFDSYNNVDKYELIVRHAVNSKIVMENNLIQVYIHSKHIKDINAIISNVLTDEYITIPLLYEKRTWLYKVMCAMSVYVILYGNHFICDEHPEHYNIIKKYIVDKWMYNFNHLPSNWVDNYIHPYLRSDYQSVFSNTIKSMILNEEFVHNLDAYYKVFYVTLNIKFPRFKSCVIFIMDIIVGYHNSNNRSLFINNFKLLSLKTFLDLQTIINIILSDRFQNNYLPYWYRYDYEFDALSLDMPSKKKIEVYIKQLYE